MWIARDLFENALHLFADEPVRLKDCFICTTPSIFIGCTLRNGELENIPCPTMELTKEAFPEITWENSPQELKI